MHTVFIDGQEGTTGLRIHERLKTRDDIEILEIPYEERKNKSVKSKFLNEADVVIFCLPDAAAKESASMIVNSKTCVIDASTAFRTHPDWTYGLPELNKNQRNLIQSSKRIANPGCHATGFLLAIAPLLEAGIITEDYPVTATSITGYSGGGKAMIAKYQNEANTYEDLNGPRHYALGLVHKHLPEMKKHSGLVNNPLFMPIIANFYNGMVVSIPLHSQLLSKRVTVQDLYKIMSERYENETFVNILPIDHDIILENGFLPPTICNETNRLEIIITGNDEHMLVMARFDNLGKGASGAAVQNLNIVLGIEESLGLK